jgi:hypothetical protein
VYLDLQNLARRQQRPTDELHQLYALEGFLARLASSRYADRLVLKGGALLAAYGSRRPTRDIDLYARQLRNDLNTALECTREIAEIELDDSFPPTRYRRPHALREHPDRGRASSG